MRKDGFTLTELLVVVAILGLLATLVLPNFIESYKTSLDKSMEIVETNVSDAALVYETEHCTEPLFDPITNTRYECDESYKNNKYICLDTLIDYGYIDNVKYGKKACNGFILYNKGNAKTYLYCEDYVTDKSFDKSMYDECLR